MEEEDLSETDSEEDEDYNPENDPDVDDETNVSESESPQEVEVEEEYDHERGDKLWEDFLTTAAKKEEKKLEVNTETDSSSKTPAKTKVYEFAGEKVNLNSGRAKAKSTDKSWMNGNNPSVSYARLRFGGQCDSISNKEYPSPGTGLLLQTVSSAPVKRGGLSFLSGDPELIGLSGPSKGGLSNVLAALQNAKRQKIGTLEKSRLDWEAFKKNEGIEEELQSQIKSKDGYLERQEFLQRSDLRAFELEKDIRSRNRRHP